MGALREGHVLTYNIFSMKKSRGRGNYYPSARDSRRGSNRIQLTTPTGKEQLMGGTASSLAKVSAGKPAGYVHAVPFFSLKWSQMIRRTARRLSLHELTSKTWILRATAAVSRRFYYRANLRSCNLTFHVPQVFPGLILLPQKHISLDQTTVAIDARDGVQVLFRERIGNHRAKIAQIIPAID